MSLTRRQLLGGVGAGLATLGLRRDALGFASARRPTTFVQIFMHGGIDAMLTTNPHRKADVDPRVDVPYSESAITQHGSVRVGPLWSDLGPTLERAAIVNGVRVTSLAHKTATDYVRQMRTVFPSDQDPGIAGAIGSHLRDGRPLDYAVLGSGWSVASGYRPPARCLTLDYDDSQDDPVSLVDLFFTLSREPKRAEALAGTLSRQLASPGGSDRMAVETTLALLRAMPTTGPPTPSTRYRTAHGAVFAKQIRDAAFLLRHGITRSLYIDLQFNFDSHARNLDVQTRGAKLAVGALHAVEEELRSIPGDHGGTLYDDAVIVMSSELGRFPFLNQWDGKDHFPELPFLVVGSHVRPGQYGETDKLLTGQPVSMATGRPSSTARDRNMMVDDVGITLLDRFGVPNARSRGYVGTPLEFLFA